MEEKQIITAEDVTDIVLKQAGYYWNSGYNEFEFACKINGADDSIRLMEYRHDDGYGVTIHSEKNDIWDQLPKGEVFKLEDKLQDAIQYGQYHKKIESAKNMDAIDDVRFELMEDNNPNLNHVIKKLWSELEKKMESLEKPSVKEKLAAKKKEVEEKKTTQTLHSKNKENSL